MSSSAAVADILPPKSPGPAHQQPAQSPQEPHKSPTLPSSPPPTNKYLSHDAVARNGALGHVAPSEHDESEAETVVLSPAKQAKRQQDGKAAGRMIKHERSEGDEEMHRIPARLTAVASKEAEARRSPARSHGNGNSAEKTNGEPEVHGNSNAQENGSTSRKPSSTYSGEQSRAGDGNAHVPPQSSGRHSSQSPPRQRDHRARSTSTTDSRKRKLRDDSQALSGTEPPRQRHKTEGLVRSVHRHQASSPISTGVKAHKRSASTQSLIQLGGRKRRRSPQEKNWTDDDEEEDDASSPHPHSNIPALSRPRRSAHRSMTSPVRTMPPKKKDAFGATRLLRSCEKGDFEAVKAAYDQSPDEVDTPDYAGITPLQKASLNGHDDIVQFLLDQNCQTDCHDFVDQDTPLIDAVCNGHLEVVKLLLWRAKVDPTHENKLGKNALALLDPDIDEADEIREELDKAFAERRKDKSEDDDDNRSPIEEPSIPTLLPNEYNAEVLRIKSEQGDKRAVDALLASGIMPNVACGVAAARGGHDEILSFLLATGLSADHRDPGKHNETPMLVAIKKGHLNVIRLLLAQEEFDPTRTNRAGLTYWEFAEDEEGPNWREIRDVLKKAYDDHMRPKQSKRIRSPRMDRSDLKSSPRRRQSDQDKRSHDSREGRGRPMEKANSRRAPSENALKPKKRLISRRELNRQSGRDSSTPDISEEDEDEVRGPSRMRKSQRTVNSRTIRSSPQPSSPESQKSERRASGARSVEQVPEVKPLLIPEPLDISVDKPEPKIEPPPEEKSKLPTPTKEDTPEDVKEARLAEVERVAAEEARMEAEKLQRATEAKRLADEQAAEQHRRDRELELEKLPRALRRACEKGVHRPLHFDLSTNEGGISYNFLPVHVVKLAELEPDCDAKRRDELWMMSFQAVGILGAPCPDLRDFSAWPRKPVTYKQREGFLEGYDVSQLSEDDLFARQGTPGYDPARFSAMVAEDRKKFLDMEPLFWVRFEDFSDALRTDEYAHLAKLNLWTTAARVQARTTPPPTPRSWSEALFGVKPGAE